MSQVKEAPYGSWQSPIQSSQIASATVRLGQVAYDKGNLYWIEGRPWEAGRQVIVRRSPDGTLSDVNPSPINARTLVQEYGGGAYLIKDGVCYCSNFADQRVYKIEEGKAPVPITAEGAMRYADFAFDHRLNRLICVREDHTVEGREAVTTIVAIPLDKTPEEAGHGKVLVSGCNFYSNPRVSADGNKLAWIEWNHPNMPWDGTELLIATLYDDGNLSGSTKIAGGENESIFQPEWGADGTLLFISDRTHFWNLYAAREPFHAHEFEQLIAMDNDFGLPFWVFGTSSYIPVSANELVCCFNTHGTWQLARVTLDFENGEYKIENIETPFSEFIYFAADKEKVAMCAGSPTQPNSVVEVNLKTGASTVIRACSADVPDARYISLPKAIEFPTEPGRTAFAFFYPPKNDDYQAPHGTLPPLLVRSHGGPTGSASSILSLGSVQYWTSRGFAVVDVNYGGSTGFGRHYRERLLHNWGIVDVADCQNAARYLVEHGYVDKHHLAITGGSAGGYTTLCALTFGDTFKAGASHFGISDLEMLIADTHKFESRYLDKLVGPPSAKHTYYERSPLNFTDRLNCPVIFFQGLEDKAVPPSQAEAMVNALRKNGLPVAYIAYEGEQHGFRKAENIKRTLDAELYFYSRIFGFALADEIEPVTIENLT